MFRLACILRVPGVLACRKTRLGDGMTDTFQPGATRRGTGYKLALLSSSALLAQTTAFGDNLNVVTSAMPMLNIGPDARMGGLANAGVAASPDANALFWNPAKLAFMGAGNMQGGLSYTPWLRRLVPDVELMFANVAMGLGERSGFGASLRSVCRLIRCCAGTCSMSDCP